MRSTTAISIAAAIAVAACSKTSGRSDAPSAPRPTSPSASAEASPAERGLQWGPAPSVLPPGAEIAVLQGDPSKTDEFTLRLKFPNGYKIPPHTHPTVENVTVLAGTFLAGMGPQVVESQMEPVERGGFVSIPANHAHYAMARGETVVQVHGVGPFAITYVNQADPVAR